MSTLTGLISSGGGGSVIGDVKKLASYDVIYIAPDGTKWLRAGYYETDVSSYPNADPTIKGIASSNFGAELFTASSYTDAGIGYDGTYVYGSSGSRIRKYTKAGATVETSASAGVTIYNITVLNGWAYLCSTSKRIYRWDLNNLATAPSLYNVVSTTGSDTLKITSDGQSRVYVWCNGPVVTLEQNWDGSLTKLDESAAISTNYISNAFGYAGDGYFVGLGSSNLALLNASFELVEAQASLSTGWPSAGFIEGATFIDGEVYFSERSTDKIRLLTTTKALGIKAADPYSNDQLQEYVRIS